MRVITAQNVNYAFYQGCRLIKQIGEASPSRAGDVLVASHPVMTVYEQPTQRVLYSAQRDANPFFHFFEGLWMLSGSRDAKWLDRFVKTFSSRFAEDGGVQHGAYGFRWINHFKMDQLRKAIDLLRENNNDRRVVIQMWDPECDLGADVNDVPCNTQIYPRIVNGALDITITCRSNDIIWGAYGANAVHFSMMQEYMASQIGVHVGVMYQLSNNWHGYVNTLESNGDDKEITDRYHEDGLSPYPMFDDPGTMHPRYWDDDLTLFMFTVNSGASVLEADGEFNHSFWQQVVIHMWKVHDIFRESGAEEALHYTHNIQASDWRVAIEEWLSRRVK